MAKSLAELIKKKMREGKEMPKEMMDAKSRILSEIEDMADEGMAGKMSKVSVMSDSPEGLKEGMEIAEEKLDELKDKEEEGYTVDAEGAEEAASSKSVEGLDELKKGAKLDERDENAEITAEESYEMEEDYDSMSDEELEEMMRKLKAKKMSK